MHQISLLEATIEKDSYLQKLQQANPESSLSNFTYNQLRSVDVVTHDIEAENQSFQGLPGGKSISAAQYQVSRFPPRSHKSKFMIYFSYMFSCFLHPAFVYRNPGIEQKFNTWRLYKKDFLRNYQVTAIFLSISALSQTYFDIVTYCDPNLTYKSPTLCHRSPGSPGVNDIVDMVLKWRLAGLGLASAVFAGAGFITYFQGSMRKLQWLATVNCVVQSVLCW
jgi:hypothetical protein